MRAVALALACGVLGCSPGVSTDPLPTAPQRITTVPAAAYALAVLGEDVYLGASSTLYRIPIRDGVPVPIATNVLSGPIVHDADHVYFVTPSSSDTFGALFTTVRSFDRTTHQVTNLPLPSLGFLAHNFLLAMASDRRLVWALSSNSLPFRTVIGTWDGSTADVVADLDENTIQMVAGRSGVYTNGSKGVRHIPLDGRPSELLSGVAAGGVKLVGVDADGLVFIEGQSMFGYISPTERFLYANKVQVPSCGGCRSTSLPDGEMAYVAVTAPGGSMLRVDLTRSTTSVFATTGGEQPIAMDVDRLRVYWVTNTASVATVYWRGK